MSSFLPELFVGAHDALTARIGERAGFDGIWASGLGITASHGVPDNGGMSQERFLQRVESICASVRVPVWVDVDNCAPSIEQVHARVRDIERAGARGIVIEDKVIPKRNSFAAGDHELESLQLAAEKLQAAIAARQNQGFQIIARTEALIANQSVEDALDRCRQYLDCGVSGLVIHTKERDPQMMLSVLEQLPISTHLVAIPTTYFDWSASRLGARGIDTVLYANQGMRAQIAATNRAYSTILETGSSAAIEESISTVADIFMLQEPLPAPKRSVSTGGD